MNNTKRIMEGVNKREEIIVNYLIEKNKISINNIKKMENANDLNNLIDDYDNKIKALNSKKAEIYRKLNEEDYNDDYYKIILEDELEILNAEYINIFFISFFAKSKLSYILLFSNYFNETFEYFFKEVYDNRLAVSYKTLSDKEKMNLILMKNKSYNFKKDNYDIDIYGNTKMTGNSYRFENVLVDTGVSKQYLVNEDNIDYIVISHLHKDHINKTVIRKLLDNGTFLIIADKFYEELKDLCELTDYDNIITFDFYKEDFIILNNEIKIVFIKNKHGKEISYSFIVKSINTGNCYLVATDLSDTNNIENYLKKYDIKIDVILIEANYVDNKLYDNSYINWRLSTHLSKSSADKFLSKDYVNYERAVYTHKSLNLWYK